VADQKISALLPLAETDVQAATDVLPIADVSTAETKKVSPSALVGAAVRAMAPGTINGTLIQAGTVGTLQIADGAVTDAKVAAGLSGGKLIADSVTAREIAVDAITASELADGAVDTAAIVDLAVTNSKLAAGIDGAKLIAESVTSAQIAINAITASELADGAVDTPAIQDGAVVSVKIANAAVGAVQLADGGVTTAKIADAAVTGPKLAAGAVDDSKISGVNVSKLGATAARSVLAGPITGSDATATFRGLLGSDLPAATGTTNGVVRIESGSGLTIAGDGALSISSATVPDTNPVVTYNAQGIVTTGRALTGADLPLSSATTVGGVKTGSGLSVSADGTLSTALAAANLPLATDATVGAASFSGPEVVVDGLGKVTHADSGVVAGVYPKVSVNAKGHVISGSSLVESDIPSINASKLNTGILDPARLGERSITQEKLANYAISFIQEAEPASANLYHHGMLWYQESTAQLHMWNGNSWMTVGSLGKLGTENMRFCGTFNAATGDIVDLTTFGTAGAFAVGPIPAATDAMTGAYFVCKTPGTYSSVLYDNGDWVLCLGATKGWVRIDTLNGGSSSIAIKDLIDVRITAPANGETLVYDGTSGKWINRPTTGIKAAFTQAPDGIRTSFTLTQDGSAATGLLISVGGVIQEPNKDYTFVGPRTVNFTTPLPVGIDHWVIIEGVPGTGGGGGGGTTLPTGTVAQEYLRWNSTLGAWAAATDLDGGQF
jgi:hypothetical protein